MFDKEKEINGTSYWYCQIKRTKGCKAQLILENNAIKKRPKEHNHLMKLILNVKLSKTSLK